MEKIISPKTVFWLLGVVAAASIAVYRIDVVEKSLKEHEAQASSTYARRDVLLEQMKRIEGKLDRIETKLDRLDLIRER